MVNPASDSSLNRIFKTPPRGIADAGWSRLRTEVRKAGASSNLSKHLFEDLGDVAVDAATVQQVRILMSCMPSAIMHVCCG